MVRGCGPPGLPSGRPGAAGGLSMGSNMAGGGEQCCRLGSTGCRESQVAGHLLNLFLQASLSITLFIPLNNPMMKPWNYPRLS